MSDENMTARAQALSEYMKLIECSGQKGSEECHGCTWENADEACDQMRRGQLVLVEAGKICSELLEENEILRERIAIMEVEMEDDLK